MNCIKIPSKVQTQIQFNNFIFVDRYTKNKRLFHQLQSTQHIKKKCIKIRKENKFSDKNKKIDDSLQTFKNVKMFQLKSLKEKVLPQLRNNRKKLQKNENKFQKLKKKFDRIDLNQFRKIIYNIGQKQASKSTLGGMKIKDKIQQKQFSEEFIDYLNKSSLLDRVYCKAQWIIKTSNQHLTNVSNQTIQRQFALNNKFRNTQAECMYLADESLQQFGRGLMKQTIAENEYNTNNTTNNLPNLAKDRHSQQGKLSRYSKHLNDQKRSIKGHHKNFTSFSLGQPEKMKPITALLNHAKLNQLWGVQIQLAYSKISKQMQYSEILHEIIRNNNYQMMILVLQKMNRNQIIDLLSKQNRFGRDPIQFAQLMGCTDIQRLLKSYLPKNN